jgi:hypothetical protein
MFPLDNSVYFTYFLRNIFNYVQMKIHANYCDVSKNLQAQAGDACVT